MSKIRELFGHCTGLTDQDWAAAVNQQACPFLGRKCLKNRKSEPDVAIGTCTVTHGGVPVVICPHRFIERRIIFTDCLPLIRHEPGNELHIISEVGIPGGTVDYFLVSARKRKVRDFAGIEIQTLDTTGTLWPERQRFLQLKGLIVRAEDVASQKPFGMNWKMTAKTILVQLHHKVQTFESVNRHLVLAAQDVLFDYITSEFSVGHTRARGRDRPHHDAARSTAWAVVSCAEAHRPRAVVVENVPEFLGWVLFPAWRSAMLALGYDMHAQVIDSADLGMAQSRRRVYLSAARGAPAAALHIVRRSPATARGVVQWESGSWAPANAAQRRSRSLRPLCATTVRRIEDGRRRLGSRFLLPYYGTSKARTVDAPIGTLTTRERYAVVDGDRLRMLTVDEQRAFMGFPPDYALPPDRRLATHLLGNAVCPPVMREIVGVLMARA